MSARRVQEPIESDGLRDGKAFDHPAYGQISASRVSGDTTLYGSDFIHRAWVEIRVKRSQLHRDLHHDWHYARDEIVSLRLSEAQWATFVSTLNTGDGTPCTLDYVNREQMPAIPLRRVEDVTKVELQERTQELAAKVRAAVAKVEGEIGSALSGKKREAILASLRSLEQDLESNLPYFARTFAKHMETSVEKAKVEVAAYMQNAIARAGMEMLKAGPAPLQLGSGEGSDQ